MHLCIIIGNTHANKQLNLNVGGISNQILLLLQSFEKIKNINISLITRYSEYTPTSNRIKIYRIHKFNNFLLDLLYFLLKSPIKIIKIHKRTPINLINIHNSTYFYSLIILVRIVKKIPILMKIPLDFTSFINDTAMLKENKLRTRILNYTWYKFFKKFIIRKINFIRVINNTIFHDLIKLKYPKERILEIPNGINIRIFDNLSKKNREISHFGYVGRLVQIKNIRILLYAFKDYLSLYPLDKLYIYGKGPESKWISKFTEDHNLNQNIILCGYKKDKREIYSNIDVLIDPALAQGISNANLEAMSSNTLVIASDAIGNKDLIKNQINGLLFNPFKKDKLLDQLVFYKNNPKIIKNLIENAKNEILNIYDINVITNKIYSFLKSNL